MEKSSRFIRVTKDNRSKDRGVIAVDAICAAFESKEHGNTEIMTMDGFWYEVMERIEDVYTKLVACESDKEAGKNLELVQDEKPMISKPEYVKRKRMSSPAVSEDASPKRHEEVRKIKSVNFVYPKKGYGRDHRNDEISHNRGLPSGDGEGCYDMNPNPERIRGSEVGL